MSTSLLQRDRLPRLLPLSEADILRLPPDHRHGHDRRQQCCHFSAAFSPPFGHFLANHRSNTINHHLSHLPHSSTNILRIALPIVAVEIITSASTYLSSDFTSFRLFSGKPMPHFVAHDHHHAPYHLGHRSGPAVILASPSLEFSSERHRWLFWCPCPLAHNRASFSEPCSPA